MKTSSRIIVLTIAVVVLGLAAAPPVHALPVISNGGFEAGLVSWTKADQLGSEGTFFSQSGSVSPVNGDPVPPPAGRLKGGNDRRTGAGIAHPLPGLRSDAGRRGAQLRAFYRQPRGPVRDHGFSGFQHAHAEPTGPGGYPEDHRGSFSVAASDVLLNLYQTKPGDPLISGYNTIATDITALLAAHAGETLRLRFAETDNIFSFQLGVDNVRIGAIPEPASMLLLGAALALLVGWRSRPLLRFSAYRCAAAGAVLIAVCSYPAPARADTTPLALLDPNLQVTVELNAGISSADRHRLPRAERLSRAGEGLGPDQAGDQRRHSADAGARSRRQLQLGARSPEHGPASELSRRRRSSTSAGPRAAPGRTRPWCRTFRCWATGSIASSGTAPR